MKQCVIVGAGTYGQVYLEYLKKDYQVVGFIDDDKALKGKQINTINVLGNLDFALQNFDRSVCFFVPIGNNRERIRILEQLSVEGFTTPSFVHHSVFLDPTVKIGKATYILPGTSIMPLTTLKDYTMISMGVNIAHHVTISNGVFISQGTNVGASINIEEEAFLGIASTIMTGVKKIGVQAIIGAGAVIIRDVPDHTTVVGNPGRAIKNQ